MNIIKRKGQAWLAVLLLVTLLPAAVWAQTQEPLIITAPDPSPAPEEQAESVFEPLEAPRAAVNKYYTALRLPGWEQPVYAFTGTNGLTRFRVYGRLDKKKGMYETEVVTVGDPDSDGFAFAVTVTGEKPVKDGNAVFAVGKPLRLAAGEVPEGYRTTSKPGVIWFTNLFRQKEYRVLGQLQGVGDAWYPVANGRPRRGSLSIDIAQDSARFHPEGSKYLTVPREFRNGFALPVFIFTTDGQKVTVWTDKPVLDVEKLKNP